MASCLPPLAPLSCCCLRKRAISAAASGCAASAERAESGSSLSVAEGAGAALVPAASVGAGVLLDAGLPAPLERSGVAADVGLTGEAALVDATGAVVLGFVGDADWAAAAGAGAGVLGFVAGVEAETEARSGVLGSTGALADVADDAEVVAGVVGAPVVAVAAIAAGTLLGVLGLPLDAVVEELLATAGLIGVGSTGLGSVVIGCKDVADPGGFGRDIAAGTGGLTDEAVPFAPPILGLTAEDAAGAGVGVGAGAGLTLVVAVVADLPDVTALAPAAGASFF